MIVSYLDGITQHYRKTYQNHLTNTRLPQKADYLLLACMALFLLFAALILFSLGGYQVWFNEINAFTPKLPEIVLHCLTSFGDGALILALILVFAPRHAQFHWVALIAAITGGLVSNLLKEYFSAARPPAMLVEEAINIVGKAYHRNSFPSGHTLTAFLIASSAYFYVQRSRTKATLIFLASGVGVSRVLVGVHWPIDVLVGASLGIGCGMLAVFLATRWRTALTPPLHSFILFLLVAACIHVLLQKKDYPFANFLLFASALLGLLQFARYYLVLPGEQQRLQLQQNSNAWQWIFRFTSNPGKLFLLILTCLTGYRILVVLQPHFGVFYDESYYYHWSLYPDLGYYSKPPMVAWCIWLTSQVLGHGTLSLKLASPILYAASAAIIYALGQRINGTKTTGLYASVIFLCIPLIGFNSEFITTDAPLFFFWSATLYVFFIALQRNKLLYWALLGVTCGLGMLSKYTMGALPLGLFLFLFFSKSQRKRLASYGPWLAAVLAGLIFGLNIFWNLQHDWIAAKHTQEISQTSGTLFRFAPLIGFIVTQFVIFGPVWSFLLLKHLPAQFGRAKANPTQHQAMLILLFSSATLFVAIALQAFLSRAFANWAGPWMVGASLLLALCLANLPKKLLAVGAISQLLLLSAFYHWPYLAEKISIPLSKKTDPYFRVRGWRALSDKLDPLLKQYPDAVLASNSRDLIAYMGYYSLPGRLDFARWQPNEQNIRDWYDLKFNLRQYQNSPDTRFIFISNKPLSSEVKRQFTDIEHLSNLQVEIYTNWSRTLEVYLAKGFIGYGEISE
ncbi:MAG: glycosyltransferase family 39 protein [Cellvibrionaceae bacterium]|nr:glycosyltransferase family 39 protein [Cellvibrionaceae bacterium]